MVNVRAGPHFSILTLLLVAFHVIHSTVRASCPVADTILTAGQKTSSGDVAFGLGERSLNYLIGRSSNWPLSEKLILKLNYAGTGPRTSHLRASTYNHSSEQADISQAGSCPSKLANTPHSRPFWRDEVRYRVSRSRHVVIAGEAILFRRQCHTMQSRLQRI